MTPLEKLKQQVEAAYTEYEQNRQKGDQVIMFTHFGKDGEEGAQYSIKYGVTFDEVKNFLNDEYASLLESADI